MILLVVLTAAADFFVSHYISEWEYRHRDEREQYDKELHYFLTQPRQIQLAKDIRVFGLVPWLRELREKSMKALSAFIARRERTYLWANVADVALTLLRNGIAYAYLIRQTLVHGWPASTFLLYFTAVSGAASWVTGILTQCSQLHKESIDLSKIQEYLNIPEPFRFEGGVQPPAADGYELRLENVSFHYPGTERDILRHIDLTIHPGEKLAVVGLNGAGKTTMVKLLMRFYDVDSGSITLNGHDIRDFDRSALREGFGMVLQDTWLFKGTIMENIRYGRLDATDEEVIAAAKAANADHFIRTLPGGYQMELNEDASNVSQGQKQLLTIARAILADNRILILDEATSSVDTRTEQRIQTAMDNLMRGRTSFVIAHRLSTIRQCDRILVLDQGKIVEDGTYDELIAASGFFAELVARQRLDDVPDAAL